MGAAGPLCPDPATNCTVAAAFDISVSSPEIELKSRGSSITGSPPPRLGVRLRAREGVAEGEGVGDGENLSWW